MQRRRKDSRRGETGGPRGAGRSPWWLRYGWALALTGFVIGELLLSCDRPLHPALAEFLQAAGLERSDCPPADHRPRVDDSGTRQLAPPADAAGKPGKDGRKKDKAKPEMVSTD